MFNSQNAANAISTYAQTRITAYRKPQAWIGRAFVNGIVISDATVTVNASSYREAKDKITATMYAEYPGIFLLDALIDVDTYLTYERNHKYSQKDAA